MKLKVIAAFSLMSVLLFSVYSFAGDAKEQKLPDPLLIMTTDQVFYGYVIENDKLMIIMQKDKMTEDIKDIMYLYVNGKFEVLNYNQDKIEEYENKLGNANDDMENLEYKPMDENINFDNNVTVKLVHRSDYRKREAGRDMNENDRLFSIIENGQMKFLSKQYVLDNRSTAFYVDYKNKKIYFYALKLEKNEKTQKLGGSGNLVGIFIFDVKNKIFNDIRVEKQFSDTKDMDLYVQGNPNNKYFDNPIRIPNTSYLLYRTKRLGSTLENNSRMGPLLHDIPGTEFWVQEIPEWKN